MDNPTAERRRRSQRDYTLGFKLQVVAAVEKGDMTYKEAQATYGIQGRSTVLTWLRKHGKLDWTSPRRIAMPSTPKAKESPAQKIKRLEKENEDMRLKILLAETMMTIMDEDHGTDLRKKYQAKQRDAFKKKGQ